MLLLEIIYLILKHLVAGGAGFLGSYLIDYLMQNDEEVICLDNLLTGDLSNIKQWEMNPKFLFINHDVINPINLKVDKIWHFSCPASPSLYKLEPIKTLKICFEGTLNLLELAKSNKAKILFASSSEVYGKAEQYPQSENYTGSVNTFNERSCYSEGKRIAESLCYAYMKKYNLDISIARLFNVYGPRMLYRDGRVISNFIWNALQSKELIINGDGKQTRSFCYVDDVICGLLKLMNSNYKNPINFGNPNEEYSIIDLANLIIKISKSNIGIRYASQINDEPLRRKPNILLANKTLKWYPKYSIKYGLNKTFDSIQKSIKL